MVSALGQSAIVVDCTVEGLLHAPELPQILGGGARVLMISNEHPEALERLAPTADLEAKVKAGIRMLRAAKQMHVTSPAGTDLSRLARGRGGGRRLGVYDPAGHHHALAGRALPLLSRARQRRPAAW